jgi:hypothetical protein
MNSRRHRLRVFRLPHATADSHPSSATGDNIAHQVNRVVVASFSRATGTGAAAVISQLRIYPS